ncbi:MAG TPA: DNA polymerase domain-containing protein, partial [Terriglobales bacterium]|nr:DNA polymerase domain-containing protein [Terriglobales bacterium]
AAKEILESGNTSGYDPAYLQTTYEFLKGLGWVSYGYQGFSGNRIGSIEAHEAINAVSRDVILHAKEAAEEMGYEVLHLYVDSLFIRVGSNEAGLEKLREEIKSRTKLKVDLEGILRWMAFLPSKQNLGVPVPNCYFGVFRNGERKCRGIMLRRGDTPRYIAAAQEEAIDIMAKELDFDKLQSLIPELVELFKQHYRKIVLGQVELEQLVVSQTLSRNLEDIRALSPAARAALQLAERGKHTSAGQNVDFVRIRNAPYVLPRNLMTTAEKIDIDAQWYCEQLLRAANEILFSLGVSKEVLSAWLKDRGTYWSPEDFAHRTPIQLPLLEGTAHSRI